MRRRHRFGQTRDPVTESRGVQAKNRTMCWGCGLHIEVGQPFVRLRLKKSFCNVGTSLTGTMQKRSKRFHETCIPIDRNKAMDFVVNAPPPPSYPSPEQRAGAVPPPPKPATPEELALRALVAIQDAIKARARNNPEYVRSIEAEFKTFQGLTARALRPGTPDEGLTAMKFALTRALKLVF